MQVEKLQVKLEMIASHRGQAKKIDFLGIGKLMALLLQQQHQAQAVDC
jgi:hypothetical protein